MQQAALLLYQKAVQGEKEMSSQLTIFPRQQAKISAGGAAFSADVACCQWGVNAAARHAGGRDAAAGSATPLLNNTTVTP